jgi:hypothetical protein
VKNMKITKICFYVILLSLLTSGAARAQATRTWVSGVGDDANPCSRTAPCKTFAGAISKTAAGGEIDVLDPGGFGAVTITKSITIDGGGGQVASVLVAGTNGIVVSAGASDVITLRNLSINGAVSASPGINGIEFLGGAVLHIEHCTIFGFSNNGIDIEPSAGANVSVLDTISRDNGGSGIFGLSSGGTLRVTIDKSRFENNTIGVFAKDSSHFAVKDSDASGNSYVGFCALANGNSAVLDISDSLSANNLSYGVQSGGGASAAVVHLTGVSLLGNGVGGSVIGTNGSIVSFANNHNSGTGTPTSIIAPQ